MGVRNASVATTTLVTATIVTTAETIVMQTPPLNVPLDNSLVELWFSIFLVVGTAATNLIYKLRRGPLITSPLVTQNDQQTVAAGNNSAHSTVYVNSPGIVAGLIYTLTVTQVAATGDATIFDGCMIACVL